MFTVRVAVRMLTEGRDRFVAQVQRESQEVPERFDGCHRFGLFCDTIDPNHALIYEEWSSREAFDAYRTSDYFRDGGAMLFPLMDGPPDSAYFQAELVGP